MGPVRHGTRIPAQRVLGESVFPHQRGSRDFGPDVAAVHAKLHARDAPVVHRRRDQVDGAVEGARAGGSRLEQRHHGRSHVGRRIGMARLPQGDHAVPQLQAPGARREREAARQRLRKRPVALPDHDVVGALAQASRRGRHVHVRVVRPDRGIVREEDVVGERQLRAARDAPLPEPFVTRRRLAHLVDPVHHLETQQRVLDRHDIGAAVGHRLAPVFERAHHVVAAVEEG